MIWILLAVVALVLAWNFVPSLREKMKGYSTIVEGTLGTIFTSFGVFGEALEEANVAGYIPDNWSSYVPFILLGWIVVKRFQTKTPVGEK